MKKSKKIAILIFLSLLFLGACHSKLANKQKTDQNMTVSQLIKKAKTANKKVETVHFDMSLVTNSLGKKKSQTMKADLDYGKASDNLEKVSGEIKTIQGGASNYQEFILPGDGAYFRDDKGASWTYKDLTDYDVDPDYFDFLDIVYSMKDDLKLKDDGDNYTVELKSQNVDLLSLFEDELNLSLTGYSQSSMKKTFEVSFDKENFRLKAFELKMVSKSRRSRISIEVESKYSKWNKVSQSKFDAPSDVSDDTPDSSDASNNINDNQEFSDVS